LYSGGVFSVINIPGFSYGPIGNADGFVNPSSINDEGAIAGVFYSNQGFATAFVYSPIPEPSSKALLISAIALAAIVARRKVRIRQSRPTA
jgi:hypothetical protein